MDPGVKPAQPADDPGAASSLPKTAKDDTGADQAYFEPRVFSSQSLKGFLPRKPTEPLSLAPTNPKISSSVSSSATDASLTGAAVQKENGASHGRSSRKSKANALALMSAQSASVQADIEAAKRLQAGQAASNDTHLQNTSNTATDHTKPEHPAEFLQGPGPHAHPARQAAAAPKSPALDFDTLALKMPPDFPERTENRPFGFDHCPVFHPSPLDFTKPMEYIEKVSRQVMNEHGILKVVPPQGWKPPFSLDTQTFRFKTRLQRLNSLEASARANLNFLEQLSAFHSQRPGSKVSIPIIQNHKLDLWRLRKCVQELGGYHVVSNQRHWPLVVQNLGFDPRSDMTLGQQLKRAYCQIIKPFEIWLETLKVAGSSSSQSSPVPKSTSASASGTSTPATNKAFESAVTAEQVQQASSRLNDALSSNAGITADAEMSAPVEALQQSSIPVGEACEVCHQDNEHTRMILCDDCDRAYHMFCLAPPLESVPRGTWICDGCILSTGADFGFDSGKEHTLGSYRAKADDFKRHWVNESNRSRAKKAVKEEEPFTADDWERLRHTNQEDWEALLKAEHRVEEDFWRLVESPDVSVEVEYGADLHSAKYGSGFPCLERHPQQPYARDAWNLNNLPIVGGSLLRYIRSDVAGMTNPWLYAGMIFSTFAWHKEDHYTYSINYHHFGETKTWYGIPTDDDDKLEAAMTRAAPELFEQQPDLMFQLVTLLSPHRLKSEGVRVSACDQRAGEFVITLPRAYHAGFNHGFNVCEAVNFCLPDWLPHGLACTNHYAEIRKPPVFSHDELVCTIYQHERNPRSSKWLLPFFQEMVDRELASRQEVRKLRPDIFEILHDVDLPDESTQCSHCKVYCHLSQVFSEHLPAVSCAKHVQIVHGDEPVLMRVRYMDADLLAFCKRVKGRAEKLNYASYQANYEEPSGESRKSSRKRVLSAAALEAAGAEVVPVAQRPKVIHPNYDESLIPDTIDEETASSVSQQPEGFEDSRPAVANGSNKSEPTKSDEAAGPASIASLPRDPAQSRNGTMPDNEQDAAIIIDPALS